MNPLARTDAELTNQEALIVGGCPVGREIADRLADVGVAVRLVDDTFPTDPPDGLHVHKPAKIDTSSLDEVGLDEEMTVIAVNPADSMNLITAQVARTRFGVDRVLARVNDPRRVDAFEALDIESVDASAIVADVFARRW